MSAPVSTAHTMTAGAVAYQAGVPLDHYAMLLLLPIVYPIIFFVCLAAPSIATREPNQTR